MATGPIPNNQQNALPLQTISQALAGSVQFFGTKLTRYFSPTDLGINGASAVTDGGTGFVYLVTPFLDLRGTSKYAMTVRVVNAAIRVALPAMYILMQYRMGSADVPPTSYSNGGGLAFSLNSQISVMGSGTIIFAATTAGGEQQTFTQTWESSGPTGQNGALATAIGSDVRFFLNFSTNPVAAANAFTAQLWASE